MMGLLAGSFEECVNSKGKDPETIKKNVAAFRYLFAHAMPYERGSAAIGEWFEKAIYKHCGYDFSSGSSADLNALTSLSMSDFEGVYLLNAVLTERPPEKPVLPGISK